MTIQYKRPITAEDIRQREIELARLRFSFETEFFQPMIKRTFELMRERGLIPPDPEAK